MNIYIACSLTHVPRELFESYTSFIHSLAAVLSENNHVVKYALVNSDPQLADKPANEKARLCYLWDRKMVESADVVIAEASFPSTGLGIELQIAESKNIPVILCFSDYGTNKAKPVVYETPDHQKHLLQIGEGYITLMALGLPNVFKIFRYDNAMDGIKEAFNALELYNTI